MLRITGVGMVEVYLADNIAKTMAGEDTVAIGGVSAANAMQVATPPLWPDGSTAMPEADVKESIRANVGARPWTRPDRHAHRRPGAERRGAIFDSAADVGGYPSE